MDYLIRLQRLGGLSCVFVVSSFPVIAVDGSKSFSFPVRSLIRTVSSTTPGSVSLVHDFTHDKMFPSCFRHLKQDLTSKLKNCYQLVDETRPSKPTRQRCTCVVFSRPHVDIFSTNMKRTSV